MNQMKMNYESQMKKLKVEQRELDLNKKKQKDQFEKTKEEELSKIKA
mgnify:CR=1 FL=1